MTAFEATVLDVIPHPGRPPSALAALVRHRDEGGEGGTVMAEKRSYGHGYWPPAPGDVIRVTPRRAVLLSRPREAR